MYYVTLLHPPATLVSLQPLRAQAPGRFAEINLESPLGNDVVLKLLDSKFVSPNT